MVRLVCSLELHSRGVQGPLSGPRMLCACEGLICYALSFLEQTERLQSRRIRKRSGGSLYHRVRKGDSFVLSERHCAIVSDVIAINGKDDITQREHVLREV